MLSRQSKKKKTTPVVPKTSELSDDTPVATENMKEDEIEGTIDESETKIDEKFEKELDDNEPDVSSVKDEKEVAVNEGDVDSLPESQPETPAKTSKSKRSSERKSKSRSSRASKYVKII